MSKPFDEQKLSDLFDEDLNWRRRELSDIKTAAKRADTAAKPALLRATITMSYAHWEGYVRFCADRYFKFITLRKRTYSELERQIYINSFLARMEALSQSKQNLSARCKLIDDVLDSLGDTFSYINPKLIDTRSNLNTDVVKDICRICSISDEYFEINRSFIDLIILKRRNAIAHRQQEFVE